MDVSPDTGSAVATENHEAPDIDVWSWVSQPDPSLKSLRDVKDAVLNFQSLRRELDGHITELGEEPADPRVAGLARWMLGEYSRAYPLLKKAKASDGAAGVAMAECCLRGEVAVDKGRRMRRPDLAAKLLEKHAACQTDPSVYALRLEAIAFDYDMEGLAEGLKSAPASFKGSADHLHFEGRVAEYEGDYEAAAEKFKAALEADPDHRGALLRLAFQYDLGGDEDEAIDIYKRLASLQPLDVHATINYGLMMEDRERYQEAINCYRSVLEQYPAHRRATAYLRDALGSLNMVFDEDIERRHDKRNRLLRIPINDFELSVRARNCLSKMKIDSLGDLVQKTEAELLAYKNFGETSLNEIKSLLESKGLRLGMNLDEDPIPLHPVAPGVKPKETPQVELPPGVDPSVVNIVLADLELSVRCRKALAQMKVVTVGELLTHGETELLSLKNFGATSLNELRARLAEYGVMIPSA